MSDPSLAVSHRSLASHDINESQRSRSSLQRLTADRAPSPKDLRSIHHPKSTNLQSKSLTSRAVWEAPVHGWILENGWTRDLNGDRVTNYRQFSVTTFKELTEEPGYFKEELKPSEQMSALELRRYIADLSQSGFDVVRLSVQFYHKFSYPLIAFVVTLIGIPFSFTHGWQGCSDRHRLKHWHRNRLLVNDQPL